MSNSEEIKPIATSIVELCWLKASVSEWSEWSEWVRVSEWKSESESAQNSVQLKIFENSIKNLLEGFRVTLMAIFDLAKSNQCSKAVLKEDWRWYFGLEKPYSSWSLLYSTTVLYDISSKALSRVYNVHYILLALILSSTVTHACSRVYGLQNGCFILVLLPNTCWYKMEPSEMRMQTKRYNDINGSSTIKIPCGLNFISIFVWLWQPTLAMDGESKKDYVRTLWPCRPKLSCEANALVGASLSEPHRMVVFMRSTVPENLCFESGTPPLVV